MDLHLPQHPDGQLGQLTSPGDIGSSVAGALDRIDPALRHFTSVDTERAIERARTPLTGPLAGVPVAVKDLIDHAGRTTTCGSSFYRRQAVATAPSVTRLEAAGAVVIGRTNLHEFAFGFSSENHWWGSVRNPLDPETSAGGSSGGSAAAVAAGVVPLAVGTDTGGSIRVPAALCGVWGLKVTHGSIPLDGVFPLAPSLDTVGPIAADVDTLRVGYEAMAATTTDAALPDRLRIGLPRPWIDRPLDEPVSASWSEVVDALADAGHEVVELTLDRVVPPGMIGAAASAEVARIHRPWFRVMPEAYGPIVRGRLSEAMDLDPNTIAEARRWREAMTQQFLRAFDSVDVLMTPTVPTLRKPLGRDELVVGGRREHYRTALSWFSALVNHAGAPALAFPTALDARQGGGPPASLQLIGPRHSEPLLLAIGRSLVDIGIAA